MHAFLTFRNTHGGFGRLSGLGSRSAHPSIVGSVSKVGLPLQGRQSEQRQDHSQAKGKVTKVPVCYLAPRLTPLSMGFYCAYAL